MIRLLIAEDHLLVRAGIRALLEKPGDIHIVGEASNGKEAVDGVQELKPDVLVMDIMMPRLNGIQAAEYLYGLKLSSNILLLSMYSDPGFVHKALQFGVKGYVLKSSVSDELLEAVRTVAAGKVFLSASVAEILKGRPARAGAAQKDNDPLSVLSPREKEILKLIAEEHTSVEIGEILFISDKTVEKHRGSLMAKLNVNSIAQLLARALKDGLIDPAQEI